MTKLRITVLILVFTVLTGTVLFAQEAEISFPGEPETTEPETAESETVSADEHETVPAEAPPRGFSVKLELSTNFVQFFNQDVRNDTFVANAEMPREESVYFIRSPNYGDVELDMMYTDPDGLYGGKIGFRFGSFFETNLPRMEDVHAWMHVTPFFRGKLGRFTERVVEKVGGDKDLGVMLIAIDQYGNNDFIINTSDSLGLGSSVFGFLPSAILPFERFGRPSLGTLSISGFFAPNEYWLAQQVRESSSGIFDNTIRFIIPAYSTYKFGGSIKYVQPDWITIGAAYRTAHTGTESGTDMGRVSHDWGLYAIITPAVDIPVLNDLSIGLGYSGHTDYLLEYDDEDGSRAGKPIKTAIHFDFLYTSSHIQGLSLGWFNNISFHTLDKAETPFYDAVRDSNNPNTFFGDESSYVYYTELSASYDIFSFLTATLMGRYYIATMTNNNGFLGQDYGREIFIIEAFARYRAKLAEFRVGVKYEINQYGTPVNSSVLQNSSRAFSIPVGVIVRW